MKLPKEKTNQLRKEPTISFRAESDIQGFLYSLKETEQRSAFINKAIRTRIFLETNPKAVLVELIQKHYELSKHILRKIGRARKSFNSV